mgnify:CR=1 FL=1
MSCQMYSTQEYECITVDCIQDNGMFHYNITMQDRDNPTTGYYMQLGFMDGVKFVYQTIRQYNIG